MPEKNETYVDGVEKIHFLGGLVRIDFGTLQPSDANPEKPGMEFKERLITSPEGFLRICASFQQLAERLVSQGVLRVSDVQPPKIDGK